MVRTFVVALQVPGPHTVPGEYLRQAPAPLQVPSVPHDALPVSLQTLRGSDAPLLAMVHTPGVLPSVHERQAP